MWGMLMNLTTVALALLAFKLLSGNSTERKKDAPKVDFGQFLNDDTQTLIENVTKLQDKSLSQEDKTSAIFALLTNPAVLGVLSNFTGGKGQENQDQTPKESPSQQPTFVKQEEEVSTHQNDEGYTFRAPSDEAKQGFAPIEKIAGVEVSHKLYSLYDNWYAKPSKK